MPTPARIATAFARTLSTPTSLFAQLPTGWWYVHNSLMSLIAPHIFANQYVARCSYEKFESMVRAYGRQASEPSLYAITFLPTPANTNSVSLTLSGWCFSGSRNCMITTNTDPLPHILHPSEISYYSMISLHATEVA